MAEKLQLSRDRLYIPFTAMNIDVADLSLQRIAFMDTPGEVPLDADWKNATVVENTDPEYYASIGEGIWIMVGPARGDSVTTQDLPVGTYQVWVEVKVTGSDERPVRIAGTLEVI